MDVSTFITNEQANNFNIAMESYHNYVATHQSKASAVIDSDTGPKRSKFYQAMYAQAYSLFAKTVIIHSILHHPRSSASARLNSG